MSTYVISDLHGQYGIFQKLLDKVAFSDADKLYMIGDAIDRGPDGIKILERVMDSQNMHFLLGNHEYMMLNSVSPDGSASAFSDYLPGRDANLWINYNGGNKTYNKYKRMRKMKRKELIEWLWASPLSTKVEVNGKTFLLTHSFFNEEMIDVPCCEMDYGTAWEIVWKSPFRPDIYVDTSVYKAYEPWIFIVGHVPVNRMRMWEDDGSLSSYRVDNIIDIDGGCAGYDTKNSASKGGILLRLDDLAEFTISFSEI